MLHIDLKNAAEDPNVTNFTCQLMRLMMKADRDNRMKLGSLYPVEAKMVWMFKNDCSYTVNEHDVKVVDYEAIERRARAIVERLQE